MTDRNTLIKRLREAIYALGVETVICATERFCATERCYSEANQKRLDARQAEVDAIIKEVADELDARQVDVDAIIQEVADELVD